MSIFKCNDCNKQCVAGGLYRGMKVACPDCGGRNTEELFDALEYICVDCGLACSGEDKKCPVCGGRVVLKSEAPMSEYERQEKASAQHADSFRENFFWGSLLAYSTPVLIVGLLSCLGLGLKLSKRAGAGMLCGATVAWIVLIVLVLAMR